jgi:hypothetical protein
MTMETDTQGRGVITKDPNSRLDYLFNWADWMAANDFIVSYAISMTGGISQTAQDILDTVIVDADTSATPPVTITDAGVLAWFSGGTIGTKGFATCRITTNDGRIEDRTIVFKPVKDR